MLPRSWKILLGILGFLFSFYPVPLSTAAPLSTEEVPETLRPWIPWVMQGYEEKRCPFFQGRPETRQCRWPGPLSLQLQVRGGDFQQNWNLYAESFIPLPGDEKHWPQQVVVNGQAAAVIDHEGSPHLHLKAGNYNITGSFLWEKLPESLPVPPETGILQLTVEGKSILFPQRDEDGLVWIQKDSEKTFGENRIEIRVHRKMVDDIPFQLITQLTLDVSGKSQEITLPQVLLNDFIPMSLDSPLPARFERDGNLRVQVRPGNWDLKIVSRHLGEVMDLALNKHEEPWPPEEVWVFEAFNDLRLVTIEGVPSIDPQQTTLPEEWKKLPAYRVVAGDTVRLAQKRRGNSDPAPDQLSLSREWWLDFDGKGFTLRDEISGTLNRSWRLEMNPPTQLGRASVDGKDQFITQLPGEKAVGVEIRQGQVEIDADSRVLGSFLRLPAVGWEHTFQKVSAELNLPPGWRLFAVSGADHVPATWINQWTLLQIFLVLITALTFFKLCGWRWGLVAFFTLGLTFPERNSPQWIWLVVLLGVALLRILPKGKIFTLVRIYRWVALIVLLALAIPFMVQQIRVGVYPSLEYPYRTMEGQAVESYYKRKAERTEMPPSAPLQYDEAMKIPEGRMGGEGGILPKSAAPIPTIAQTIVQKQSKSGLDYDIRIQQNLQENRPGTKVQTGPGLPGWTWNKISIAWSGPVEKNQTLGLFLIPPWANLILAFLRVGLILALLVCLFGLSVDFWKRFFKGQILTALVLMGLGLGLNASPAHAEFPSDDLLEQLRNKLLEDPKCVPDCAAISRMQLEASAQQLRLRLEINAQAQTSIPVPGGMKDWVPSQATLDGKGSASLFLDEEGQLWMEVGPGVHQAVLEGPLPDRDTVQLALPTKPYFTSATLNGWTLQGLHEDGEVEANLQLSRSQALTETQPSAGGQSTGTLPPFVTVQRHLILGLNWEVITHVQRVTAAGTPVVIEIPLIPGESVTTEGMRVEKDKVSVSMAPNATEVEWRSVLKEGTEIALVAPDNAAWMETWLLDVSPVWHVAFSGIPMIHTSNESGQWLPEWRPWPKEEVKIQISRPEGVQGQTLTIDQSTLQVTPGLRYTDVILNLTLRSSLGGQHALQLPKGAELQSVSINGQVQPIRQDKETVTLPIVPGTQRFELKWMEPTGIKKIFRSSPVHLGTLSVNSETQFHLSNNRWVIYTGGPRMGPAVLFWSLFAVLLLFSYGLWRLQLTPLTTLSWVLLGVGISQFPDVPVVAGILVAGWFLVVGWRERKIEIGRFWFDLRQLFMVGYTIVFLIVLFASIHQGLLGQPEMQIAGNGSTPTLLRWFQDRSGPVLPRPYVLSLPLFYYRIAMLAWALWIAWSLIQWLRWGWKGFSKEGLWRALGVFKKKAI